MRVKIRVTEGISVCRAGPGPIVSCRMSAEHQLTDPGSRSGTPANVRRVVAPRLFADGDTIETGATRMRFSIQGKAPVPTI